MKILLNNKEINFIVSHIEREANLCNDEFDTHISLKDAWIEIIGEVKMTYTNHQLDPFLAHQKFEVEIKEAKVCIKGTHFEIENLDELIEKVEALNIEY